MIFRTQVVRFRAEQMEMMYPSGYGLAALIGLNETQVSGLVKAASSETHPVFVGNINAPRQIVIAGSIDGMKEVLSRAVELGARKAELLHVSISLPAIATDRKISSGTIAIDANS